MEPASLPPIEPSGCCIPFASLGWTFLAPCEQGECDQAGKNNGADSEQKQPHFVLEHLDLLLRRVGRLGRLCGLLIKDFHQAML